MGYKPLSAISFSELQSLLSNLTLITMDNEQVFSIAPAGFTFEDGTITLNDPPPEYALITAHMEDSAIHGDHVALNNYCLKCTATPGASATLPTPFTFDGYTKFDLLIKLRIDSFAPQYPGIPFFSIKNQANATRFAMGFEQHSDPVLFVNFGTEQYFNEPSFSGFFTGVVGEWLQFGISFKPQPTMHIVFCWNNTTSAEVDSVLTGMPVSTADTLEIGCAGISIGMVAFIMSPIESNLFLPEIRVSPYSVQRPAHSVNYYNFRPVTGVTGIKDHALISTYRTNLGLQTGATIEEVELV